MSDVAKTNGRLHLVTLFKEKCNIMEFFEYNINGDRQHVSDYG